MRDVFSPAVFIGGGLFAFLEIELEQEADAAGALIAMAQGVETVAVAQDDATDLAFGRELDAAAGAALPILALFKARQIIE